MPFHLLWSDTPAAILLLTGIFAKFHMNLISEPFHPSCLSSYPKNWQFMKLIQFYLPFKCGQSKNDWFARCTEIGLSLFLGCVTFPLRPDASDTTYFSRSLYVLSWHDRWPSWWISKKCQSNESIFVDVNVRRQMCSRSAYVVCSDEIHWPLPQLYF